MKLRVYLAILFLIIPVQATLFNPISLAGIKPDLGLAVVYIIGLLTGPLEACLAGMALGLIQDIGSASLLGLNAFTRGLAGLAAGYLGSRVLDIASPSNIVFLSAFSLAEGVFIALFMQVYYGSVPLLGIILMQVLPQAVLTGLLGTLMLRFMAGKKVMTMLMRRSLLKE
jgi:rod shape-determining protein MreD